MAERVRARLCEESDVECDLNSKWEPLTIVDGEQGDDKSAIDCEAMGGEIQSGAARRCEYRPRQSLNDRRRRERSERDKTGIQYLCARGHTEGSLRPEKTGPGWGSGLQRTTRRYPTLECIRIGTLGADPFSPTGVNLSNTPAQF